jgi:hypothetical protein
MTEITRRSFSKQTVLFSFLATVGFPGTAMAFLDKIDKVEFLKRDDLADAVKSIFMTYDGTSKYLHKFNDVIVKSQLRSLQFYILNNMEKDYVDHYMSTMDPLLQRVKKMVENDGPEKGLLSMFEGTSCSYQVFEHIGVKQGQRTLSCPYKEILEVCKKYLHTFPIEWEDVCSKWCTPTWTGFADRIGIKISVDPGETCTVNLVTMSPDNKQSKN